MTTPQAPEPQLVPSAPVPAPLAPAPAAAVPGVYSQEQVNEMLAKVRDDVKGQLYGRIEKSEAELAELRTFREQQQAAAQAEADRVAEAERKAAEAEMDAKQLLDTRTQEFERQFMEMRQEMALRDALLQKERERGELMAYIQRRVAEERDEIAPELIDYIGGESSEMVEASIATAKAKTASILEGVRQAQTQFRQEMPGVSTGAGNIGPVDSAGGQRQYTADEIAAMSPASPEYQKLRSAYGMDRAGRGHGLYG